MGAPKRPCVGLFCRKTEVAAGNSRNWNTFLETIFIIVCQAKGLSGVKDARPPREFYALVVAVCVAAVAGFIVFYDGLSFDNWYTLLLLTGLMLYLQTFTVEFSERISYSLSTATVFPIIYFFGTTWSMLVFGASAIVDGLNNRKAADRIIFNVAQFMLSALAGSLVFKYLAKALHGFGAGEAVAMALAMLVYIFTNFLLVVRAVSIWKGDTWWSQLRMYAHAILYNSLGTGFIGLIFTYFARRYHFWGAVVFGALLIYLGEMLKTAVSVTGERSRRRELESELLVDEMTQAYNFRYLSQWFSDPREEKVAVLFLDVDNFKGFNDRYGHAEGDRVLRAMVETINKSVRASDKVIRYGGDEFVILLFGMGKEGALRTAERIVQNVNRSVFGLWDLPVTVSIGIASSPDDTTDKRQLLLMSDQAMYAGKQSRTNSIQLWTAEEIVP